MDIFRPVLNVLFSMYDTKITFAPFCFSFLDVFVSFTLAGIAFSALKHFFD